jgi:hypothetical protein
MRQALLASILILSCLGSCKKEDDDTPYIPPYRLEGVVDLTLSKLSSGNGALAQMPINVEYENGVQERVTLSLEDVPAGLKDSIVNTSGYPSFSSMLWFIDSGVNDGSYTMKLVAQGSQTGRTEFPFTLTVLPTPDCITGSGLVGTYTSTSTCVSGGAYTVNVQASASVKNQLVFPNLNNNGLQIVANVNCDGGGSFITIPTQSFNGVTYSGFVSFLSNGLRLNVSNGTTGCNYFLTR